ncbi:MAG: PKD domain-containing protein, partial [Gemmatimonadales bacterium]
SSIDDGTFVSYAWALGRFPDPTATGLMVSAAYPHTGLRTVTLTVTDNNGKSSSITKTVDVGGAPPVDNPPVPSFTWSCSFLSCTLNGGASTDDGSIQQYAWSMTGGTPGSATGVSTAVSYPTAGSRSVTLTVTDNAGQTATLTRTVTVSAPPPPPVDNPPVASFTWSCPTLTCQLDASSSSDDGTIVSYAWNLGRFPDPTATGVVAVATYPHGGSRTVTLTVTDNSGKTNSITKVLAVP